MNLIPRKKGARVFRCKICGAKHKSATAAGKCAKLGTPAGTFKLQPGRMVFTGYDLYEYVEAKIRLRGNQLLRWHQRGYWLRHKETGRKVWRSAKWVHRFLDGD